MSFRLRSLDQQITCYIFKHSNSKFLKQEEMTTNIAE